MITFVPVTCTRLFWIIEIKNNTHITRILNWNAEKYGWGFMIALSSCFCSLRSTTFHSLGSTDLASFTTVVSDIFSWGVFNIDSVIHSWILSTCWVSLGDGLSLYWQIQFLLVLVFCISGNSWDWTRSLWVQIPTYG